MLIGDVFDPFAKVSKYMKVKDKPISVDNWIFGLHRKPSRIIAFLSLLFIISYPAILENPIACVGPKEKQITKDFLDEWCWLSGTYVIPEHIGKTTGREVVFSGVGPDEYDGSTTRLYHNEYIYFPVVFLLQLLAFRCSKDIWRQLEAGKLKMLLSELTSGVGEMDVMKQRINIVTDYFTTSPSRFHDGYSCRYIFCEIFNAVNIIIQFWALHLLLHEEFFSYGWDAINYLSVNHPLPAPKPVDPFTKLFPKLAICHLDLAGPSGNAIPYEALCVLPLNNIADKIFLFWWFWLLILGFFTISGLIYRGMVLCSGCARYAILRYKTTQCSSKDLRYVVDNFTYGDWFVLSLMQKNMDCMVYAEFIQELIIKKQETIRKQH